MEAHTAVTRRVLVLCSDTANSRTIEDATRSWMFETVVCSSLREAEDLLAEKNFALVFCEERFVDGTYADLLALVGRSKKVAVVVMISDVDKDSVFREAIALGALGVVANPCSIPDAQWMVIRATEHGSGNSRFNSRNASAASNGVPRPE
jgi:DNA-binding NtrC family response regulator